MRKSNTSVNASTAELLELLMLQKFCILLAWLSCLHIEGQLVFVCFLWGKTHLCLISNCAEEVCVPPSVFTFEGILRSTQPAQPLPLISKEETRRYYFFLSWRVVWAGARHTCHSESKCVWEVWSSPCLHLSASWLAPRRVFSPGRRRGEAWGCELRWEVVYMASVTW